MIVPPVEIAEKMLAQAPPSFEVLKIHQFQTDHEAHDDQLQEKLAREFDDAFASVLMQLRVRFEEPSSLDTFSEDLPMGGFRNAVWLLEEKALSLVAFHEDREVPYVLLLSVTPKKSK